MDKKQLNSLLKNSKKVSIDTLKDNDKIWEGKVRIEKGIMSSKGFNDKQLEQLKGLIQPIVDRLDKLENEMVEVKQDIVEIKQDIVEVKKDVAKVKQDVIRINKAVNKIESLPTVKKELKESNKK